MGQQAQPLLSKFAINKTTSMQEFNSGWRKEQLRRRGYYGII